MNRQESEYLAIAAKDLTITSEEIAVLPLAQIAAVRPLPLDQEVNPAWSDRIAYVCHDFQDAVRAGILTPDDLPDEIAAVVGRKGSRQVGVFVNAMYEAIDRTGRVGMTAPEADALAARLAAGQ